MPEADVLFVAGFQQCKAGIAGEVAAGARGYSAARDLGSDVIFGYEMPISA